MNRRCRVSGILSAVATGLVALSTLTPGIDLAGLAVTGNEAFAIQLGAPRVPGPDDTEPQTSEPETSEPETSEPVETAPVDATGDQESDDVNEVVAIVSVLAFVAIVSVAAWWMVRRVDEDDPRRPPPLNEPLPGQDLV